MNPPDDGSADQRSALAGKRILLIEDEMMLAMSLQALLETRGCRITKMARLEPALAQAQQAETFDAALLDINLGGREAYAVADALAERQVPFIFLTGYHADQVKPAWRDRPVLEKPFDPNQLERLMIATLAPASAAPPRSGPD